MPRFHAPVNQRLGVAVFLCVALFVLASSANAQQPANSDSEERERGIQLNFNFY